MAKTNRSLDNQNVAHAGDTRSAGAPLSFGSLLLLTATLITTLFLYGSSKLTGDLFGTLRLSLIRNNIGPWAKYRPVIDQYEKTLSDSGPRKHEALLKVARSSRELSAIVGEQAAKHHVNRALIDVLLSKESNTGTNASIRFEPTWMDIAKQLSSNSDEQKMLASSHGPMQIAGWWVDEFNRKDQRFRGIRDNWTDLYDMEFNVELGTLILKQCMRKYSSKTKPRQVWEAFRCYNGSGQQAVTYANDAYRRLAERLISQL